MGEGRGRKISKGKNELKVRRAVFVFVCVCVWKTCECLCSTLCQFKTLSKRCLNVPIMELVTQQHFYVFSCCFACHVAHISTHADDQFLACFKLFSLCYLANLLNENCLGKRERERERENRQITKTNPRSHVARWKRKQKCHRQICVWTCAKHNTKDENGRP